MKLLKVIVNNYKVCEDNLTISFIPTEKKTLDDKEFELIEIDDELFLFNTIGIIGKNASGKTTIIELLSIIYDIFSNFKVKNSGYLFKYITNTINLDVTFYHDKKIYRYKVDLCKDLNSFDTSVVLFKNEELYVREYKKTHSRDLFSYDKFKKVDKKIIIPEDTSILFTVFNTIALRGVYYPCEDVNEFSITESFNLYKIVDENLGIIESLIRMFDEHIKNIEMINENKYKITYKDNKTKEISEIELLSILSSGTKKGISLFIFVIYSLKTGTDLIIDEIENHFHKTIIENLINLYKDKTINKYGATLIFTTHYCELLELFNRQDNIFISKYNQKIILENMHEDYKFRNELSKSKIFYNNEFGTDVDYQALMDFKKELM